MKKILTLAAIVLVAFTTNAQPPVKSVDAKAFRNQAAAAIKDKSAQQGMKNIDPNDECGAYIKSVTTTAGETYQQGKEYLIVSNDGATGFAFSISNLTSKGEKYIQLVGLALEKGVCVDNSSKITITFEDGATATLNNYKESNCDGLVMTFLGKALNNDNVWEKLKTTKVKAVKLEGVEKTVARSFSESNQAQIQGTIKCL